MINKVTLIGNLGMDPELKHLENGTAVARLSIATNENYKDKEGNWQKQTEWHNVVVWRDLAEKAGKYFRKGMLLYVEGKISYRKYEGQDGVEKYITDIVAGNVRALEKIEYGENTPFIPTTEPGHTTPAQQDPAGHSTAAPPPAGGDGSDLPF